MRTPVDATRGPLLRALVRLAIPVVAMQACHTLFHLVNVMWVGRLGASATAAVTTSFFVIWIYALADLPGVAVAATVSRHVGAREPKEAGYAAAQALWMAVVLGLLLTVLSHWFVRPLFVLLGAAPDVREQAVTYLSIIFAGAVFYFLYVTFEAILRAAGDTRTPFVITAVMLAINAVLDPFLIFGLGPFPRLGIAGAAIGSLVSQAVAVTWFVALALRRHLALPLDFAALRKPSLPYALAMARIGAPFALIGLLYSAAYLYLASLAARFGTPAVAVLGVSNRIESTVYLVGVGFGLACEAVVGQNLGAGRPDRAERAAWLSTGVMGTAGLVATVALFLWPEVFLALFTSDAQVIALGAPYLRILALNQVFTAIEMVMNGAFSGAGDTLPPMLISIVISIVRVPMAWWLAVDRGMGLIGIAWMITVTCAARGLLLAFWYRRGAWKTKALATQRAEATPQHPLPAADAPL